ncbi:MULTISPECIES: acyl carrier protein [Rufibacter]|uniref:Acyl carrier protein n=1 Tax=Rufibacter quisquiliarum TaxID=1549639 RepID=A0A839GPL5_9BACT|nr:MULTISPECIES: acyl carrier protein [Rufibacter]MBA9076388.1 acyl carrier protein [Rufibacter quisquiliarum]
MISAVAVPSVAQKVVRIISKIKEIKPSRLRVSSHLKKELGFDTLDLVSVIWELEKSFKIVIPDEVPFTTVGDFVEYVSKQANRKN